MNNAYRRIFCLFLTVFLTYGVSHQILLGMEMSEPISKDEVFEPNTLKDIALQAVAKQIYPSQKKVEIHHLLDIKNLHLPIELTQHLEDDIIRKIQHDGRHQSFSIICGKVIPHENWLIPSTAAIATFSPSDILQRDIQFYQTILDYLDDQLLNNKQKKALIKKCYQQYLLQEHNIFYALSCFKAHELENLRCHQLLTNNEIFEKIQSSPLAKAALAEHITWMLVCICKSGNIELLDAFLTKYNNVCNAALSIENLHHIAIYAAKHVVIHDLEIKGPGFFSKKQTVKVHWNTIKTKTCWPVFYKWFKQSRFYTLNNAGVLYYGLQKHIDITKMLMIKFVKKAQALKLNTVKNLIDVSWLYDHTEKETLIDRAINRLLVDFAHL